MIESLEGSPQIPPEIESAPTRHDEQERDKAEVPTTPGRKIWTRDETQELLDVWHEEAARVWASAGKRTLSIKSISEILQSKNFDRDPCQIEAKIKAFRRDFKQVNSGTAIPVVHQRIAPYIDLLGKIFEKEQKS